MKNVLFFSLLLGVTVQSADAQKSQRDSLKSISLSEVVVKSTRVNKGMPMSYTNVNRSQIVNSNFGQDLPMMLRNTPSLVVTSNNGLGVGDASFRVRGTESSRINVTFDGVPMNDAEDQAVFWCNMGDFASGLQSMQIQRGAGTSTNGGGAFGATLSMQSLNTSLKPYCTVVGTWGSYNTYKYSVNAGTGLLNNHFAFEGRYSQNYTDGYVDNSAAKMRTYSVQGTYYGNNFFVRYRNFGSWERVNQAYNGISDKQLSSNRKYNGSADNSYGYPYTDNYFMNHNYLTFAGQLGDNLTTNLTLHYTHGHGYYDCMKEGQKAKKFGFLSWYNDKGEAVEKNDLVRSKGLDNVFWGGIYNLSYSSDALEATLGVGANHFDGDHFGTIKWSRYGASADEAKKLFPGANYYFSNAKKSDYNAFVKANYHFTEALNGYVDLQYRGVDYNTDGTNDHFFSATSPQSINVDKHWNFFNPKFGLNYEKNGHNVYGSFSVAHREPSRNNYTDNCTTYEPMAERLFDYELGYKFSAKNWYAGANLYYMDYKNQLVLNGQISDIGEALTVNVDKSYRAGIEIEAGVKICRSLRWDVNATLSRNRIKDYEFSYTLYNNDDDWAYVFTNEQGQQVESWDKADAAKAAHVDKFSSTPIAFSPSFIGNNTFTYTCGDFTASLVSQYVSRQYLDNSGSKVRSLD
ncbi:MAG: TonB-dependent receptor, partial [Bacteroidaceae bacterium]|nr:TonB-dependent receptor [Bacteroidaceae bacterium]